MGHNKYHHGKLDKQIRITYVEKYRIVLSYSVLLFENVLVTFLYY